jgi:AbrB family looped-hinge helix DNA binding protein
MFRSDRTISGFPIILVGLAMTQTVVDGRGRVLIPEEIREISGLQTGTVVAVEKHEGRIVITPLRKSRRTWKQLCGLAPQRTGEPQWPTPEEIKSIWQ